MKGGRTALSTALRAPSGPATGAGPAGTWEAAARACVRGGESQRSQDSRDARGGAGGRRPLCQGPQRANREGTSSVQRAEGKDSEACAGPGDRHVWMAPPSQAASENQVLAQRGPTERRSYDPTSEIPRSLTGVRGTGGRGRSLLTDSRRQDSLNNG